MKKSLLFTALGSLALGAMAQTEPVKIGSFHAGSMSANGRYLSSAINGTVSLYDSEKNQVIFTNSYDGLGMGNGRNISDNGVFLIGDMNAAWLVIDGKEVSQNVLQKFPFSSLNAITPDGKYLCGSVSNFDIIPNSDDNTMYLPVVYTLGEDNQLSEPEYLPYPALDFLNKPIQYASAVNISNDGKTICGLVTDWFGFMSYPIIYTKDADGKWSYDLPTKEYLNPNNLVLPEDPGEAKQAKDFMTPEEIAAYQEAYNKWQAETPNDYANMPLIENYMTAEELAAFNAYAKEFNQKLEEYYIIRNQIIDETLKFEQNITCISTDGNLVAAAATVIVPNDDPTSWYPTKEIHITYIFNLADGTTSQLECVEGIVPSTITNDGTVFCGTIQSMMSITPLSGLVGNVATTTTQPLVEYLSTINPAYGTWMKENCTRMITTGYDPETYEPIEENIVFSGRPLASADGKTIATAIDFVMDEDEYVTVLFPANSSAISNVASDLASFKVNASVGGVINVNGQAASIAVYDLSGRVVFTADAVEGAVATGLNAGVYVVKAVAADGQTVTEKVAF